MQIWVDADACPSAIKDILFRAAERERIHVTFVANKALCSAGMELESLSRSNRDRTDIFLELMDGEVGDEEVQKALRA